MPVIGLASGKIGLRPGLGLAEVLNVEDFTIDSYLLKVTTGGTFTLDSRLAARLTDTFTMDTHILTGIYTDTFTIDCELLKAAPFTVDSYLSAYNTYGFSVDSRLASILTDTFTVDTTLADLAYDTFTVDSYLLRIPYQNFNIDSRLATQRTKTFTADSSIASTLTDTFTIDGYVASYGLTDTFEVDCTLADFYASEFTIDCTHIKMPYYQLGTIDITDHIEQPDIDGLQNKVSDYSAHNDVRSTTYKQGVEPLKFSFNVWWFTQNDYDTFLAAVNSTSEDINFYHGRSDWFYRVKNVSVVPVNIDHGRNVFVAKVNLVLEDPYIYSISYNDLNIQSVALPYTSTVAFTNHGNVTSPFYSVSLAGKYAGGLHTRDLTFSIMDGAVVESSLEISDRLLSDEIATLDIDGNLTCTYTDTYADSTKFTPDKYASSNANVTGGALVISSAGYVTYKLYGPHPTKQNLKLTANITTTGSPYIQVSSNNSTWYTAVSASSIVSGTETEYDLDYSDKLADLYVRLYCPAGSTMSVASLEIEAIRDTSYYDIPEIGYGDSRTIKISDGATSSHYAGLMTITFRAKKWST